MKNTTNSSAADFIKLHEQLTAGKVDEIWLTQIESMDNIFPEVNYRYWA